MAKLGKTASHNWKLPDAHTGNKHLTTDRRALTVLGTRRDGLPALDVYDGLLAGAAA
jgi:hypothetical protein